MTIRATATTIRAASVSILRPQRSLRIMAPDPKWVIRPQLRPKSL
jgi:hypothetical protein